MTRSRGIREHHGRTHTRAYNAWRAMRQRCFDPGCPAYADYGARGITVCAEWVRFTAFYADMGDPPGGTSLDRVDNSLGYGPKNCRWATPQEQARNKRNNVLITIGEETLPLSEWADRYGIRYATAHRRIRMGWPPALAVVTPLVRERKGVPRGQRIGTFTSDKGAA